MKASENNKIVIAVITGTLVSLIISVLLLGVAAIMISNGKLSEQSETVITVGIRFLAVFAGTSISGIMSNRRWIASVCTFAATIIITILINLIVYGGEFYNIATCISADMIGLSGSLMAMIFTKNQKNKGIKKYRPR